MYGMSIKAYWANTVRSTVLLLLVVFEEISHFIHGVFKILKLRKINYAAAAGKDKEFYPAYRSSLLYVNCCDYDWDRCCIIYKFKE